MNAVIPQLLPAVASVSAPGALAFGAPLAVQDPASVYASARDIDREMAIALGECKSNTRHALFASLPRCPSDAGWFDSTVATLTQGLRLLLGGFNDERNLREAEAYTRASPLGPLTFAVRRAIARNEQRGEGGPAPILEIGAGQRFVPWGLKQIFGESIRTHESSPRYARLADAIDVELPRAFAHEAVLPRDHFELAYSIYGSFYSPDQIEVLQRVIDGMRIGGELFLMWKSHATRELAALANGWRDIFFTGGLELSVREVSFSNYALEREDVTLVWARKRAQDVDVRSLFSRARDARRRYEHAAAKKDQRAQRGEKRGFRFSTTGESFAFAGIATLLPWLVERLVGAVCEEMGKDPVEVKHKLYEKQLEKRGDSEAAVRDIADTIVQSSKFMSDLRASMPLSLAVMQRLHRMLAVYDADVTLPTHEYRLNFHAYLGMLRR